MFAWVVYEFAFYRILMDVVLVMQKILSVANSVIRESALPDLSCAPDHRSERVRVTALE